MAYSLRKLAYGGKDPLALDPHEDDEDEDFNNSDDESHQVDHGRRLLNLSGSFGSYNDLKSPNHSFHSSVSFAGDSPSTFARENDPLFAIIDRHNTSYQTLGGSGWQSPGTRSSTDFVSSSRSIVHEPKKKIVITTIIAVVVTLALIVFFLIPRTVTLKPTGFHATPLLFDSGNEAVLAKNKGHSVPVRNVSSANHDNSVSFSLKQKLVILNPNFAPLGIDAIRLEAAFVYKGVVENQRRVKDDNSNDKNDKGNTTDTHTVRGRTNGTTIDYYSNYRTNTQSTGASNIEIENGIDTDQGATSISIGALTHKNSVTVLPRGMIEVEFDDVIQSTLKPDQYQSLLSYYTQTCFPAPVSSPPPSSPTHGHRTQRDAQAESLLSAEGEATASRYFTLSVTGHALINYFSFHSLVSLDSFQARVACPSS